MKKLSGKDYWDSIYKDISKDKDNKSISLFSKFKDWLKHISRDYSNYVLFEVLYPKYLPKNSNFKILEVGCAPGKYLIHFHHNFGYQPYGVEYSKEGCVVTKDNFTRQGINGENVIQADFFDEEFQLDNRGKYDVVFSRGFIEHFDDVDKVVNDHLNLLNDNGYLVISIPNLSGLNYYLLKFLNISSLLTHNFSIMNKKVFSGLFENKNMNILYSDYVGTFSVGLMNTNAKWKYYLYRISLMVQRPFDALWRFIFGPYHLKSRYTSPYLLFIGRKRS